MTTLADPNMPKIASARRSLVAAMVLACIPLSCRADRDSVPPLPSSEAAAAAGHEPPRRISPEGETEDASREPPRAVDDREDVQRITFDAGDAGAVPAEGVVAQPQREALPSMMSGMGFGPSR